MYWTAYGNYEDQIERASMDGTSREVLHSTNLLNPLGLTMDYDSQTLYWIDSSLDKLESSSADGSNRRLVTRVNVICPLGITFFDRKLFWGDTCHRVIYSTHINSPNTVNSIVSTGNNIHQIRVIAEQSQPVAG